MLKVGLTGGIASGKTTVSELFTEKGIDIIDADLIARQLVEPDTPCYKDIITVFGNDVLNSDNTINRQYLRQRIFNSLEDKVSLERILHPVIRSELLAQSEQATSAYCILAIPLLVESKMTKLVNRTLVVDISPSIQLKRLCLRESINEELALKMMSNQCSRKDRLSHADDIIRNDFFHQELKFQVEKLHQKYTMLANLKR